MVTSEFDSFHQPPTYPSEELVNLAMIWRQKVLIVGCVLIAVLVSLVYRRNIPSRYESTAQVLVVKQSQDMSQIDEFVAIQADLIKSPMVVERALNDAKFPLDSFAGKNALKSVTNNLTAKVDGNLLSLSYTGSTPKSSKLVLNSVIRSYEQFLNESLRSHSQQSINQIRETADDIEARLKAEESQLKRLREELPFITNSDGQNVIQKRLSNLEQKQYDLQVRRTELELRLEMLRKEADSAVRNEGQIKRIRHVSQKSQDQSRQNKYAVNLGKELLPLQLREAKLLENVGEEHPDVIQIRRQISRTRELYMQLQKQLLDAEESDLSAAEEGLSDYDIRIARMEDELADVNQAEAAVQVLLEQEQQKAREMSGKELEARRLSESIERTRRIRNGLLDELQQATVQTKPNGYRTTVIAPSEIGKANRSALYKAMALSVFLGGVIGFGLAALLEFADKRFRSPNDIPARLGKPLLAEIPFLKTRKSSSTVPAVSGPVAWSKNHPTRGAEPYRSIRTSLLFDNLPDRKVIQITSPSEGEGKTTTTVNLGIALAEAGRKTLLIDANLRNPELHRRFGLTANLGLTDLLAGQEPWQTAVQKTEFSNLDVLPAGDSSGHPTSERLTSPRLGQLLESVKSSYDLVLIDTSALLEASDARLIAYRVDQILLTLRLGRNDRARADQAFQELNSLRDRVFGVIANNTARYQRGLRYNPFQPENPGGPTPVTASAQLNREIETTQTDEDDELSSARIAEMEETLQELKSELQQATESESAKVLVQS